MPPMQPMQQADADGSGGVVFGAQRRSTVRPTLPGQAKGPGREGHGMQYSVWGDATTMTMDQHTSQSFLSEGNADQVGPYEGLICNLPIVNQPDQQGLGG